jgi:hypothetical protein
VAAAFLGAAVVVFFGGILKFVEEESEHDDSRTAVDNSQAVEYSSSGGDVERLVERDARRRKWGDTLLYC